MLQSPLLEPYSPVGIRGFTPRGTRGVKSRMCPPYPHACRKKATKMGRRGIAKVDDTALH